MVGVCLDSAGRVLLVPLGELVNTLCCGRSTVLCLVLIGVPFRTHAFKVDSPPNPPPLNDPDRDYDGDHEGKLGSTG